VNSIFKEVNLKDDNPMPKCMSNQTDAKTMAINF